MHTHLPSIGAQPLGEICIPGSHDSGSSCVSYASRFGNSNNTVTQSLDVFGQLEWGTRRFDIRPTLISTSRSGPSRDWACGHYIDTKIKFIRWQGASGQTIEQVIDDINRFTTVNPELVILKISHLHRLIVDSSWEGLGVENKEIQPRASDLSRLWDILGKLERRYALPDLVKWMEGKRLENFIYEDLNARFDHYHAECHTAKEKDACRAWFETSYSHLESEQPEKVFELQHLPLNQFIGSERSQGRVIVLISGADDEEYYRRGFWPTRQCFLNARYIIRKQSKFDTVFAAINPFRYLLGARGNFRSILSLAKQEQKRQFPWVLRRMVDEGWNGLIVIDDVRNADLLTLCLAITFARLRIGGKGTSGTWNPVVVNNGKLIDNQDGQAVLGCVRDEKEVHLDAASRTGQIKGETMPSCALIFPAFIDGAKAVNALYVSKETGFKPPKYVPLCQNYLTIPTALNWSKTRSV